MPEKIDLRPIQEEHFKTLRSFLDAMDIGVKVDPIDMVIDTTQLLDKKFVFSATQLANHRVRDVRLDDMNIDRIRYNISQWVEDYRASSFGGGVRLTDKWWAGCEYYVCCYTGKDKKGWKNLEAEAKIKRKGKEITDFKWTGGKIAEVLNKDTSLKEPLLAHLNVAQTEGNYACIRITPEPQRALLLSDKEIKKIIEELMKSLHNEGTDVDFETACRIRWPMEEGVIIRNCITLEHKNEVSPLLLPSRDAFKAYDRIAKHIKQYVIV